MGMEVLVFGYIDPSTSQHVFSLLGPMLILLTTTGGVIVTALIFVPRRIVSCFRNASWTTRVAVVSMIIGAAAVITAVACWIIP